ncbi:HAMP domain-containing sensor histidine kinase [Streptomyces sp. DSM 41982]|uniref:histidine kinase n=1 Tax=Streptomyces evansiae TaxID=3075535 RepID=A0ABD5EAM6_9ACTN|nr:HAMP domain-containing sensor histidine kinase [Streptomyces sp. DSM 41982]MDT0418413.1 HAMP domain-containing sensor histidine kinase [Streptomyces sp. DSM 41982]SCE35128.1 two-component system, OmpR family, sensor kinase [Streptomyces sp. SolWspMP-sol7th]
MSPHDRVRPPLATARRLPGVGSRVRRSVSRAGAVARRLRPRSLRARLVLIATLLATSAVLLCQLAGLVVLRGWLTDQVDERLSHFRPPPGVYEDLRTGGEPHGPGAEGALPSDYRVFFYDETGRLSRVSLGTDDGPGPKLPRQAAALRLTGRQPRTLAAEDEGGSAWRAVTFTGPGGIRTVVALPLDTVDGATAKLLWLSLGLGLAVSVGVVVLGGGAVRLGLRPLTRVEHTARHITKGALGLSVPVADPDTEVGRLGLALNTMLDRLRDALRRTEASESRLRRFMADAGHELRTPLTAVQGFAELLLDEPATAPERRAEALALVARNADRMSRLVDDLFLLAKLGDTPAAHREPVDLLSLAADAIATTAIRHPRRPITLEPLTASPAHDLNVIEAPGDPHQLAQVLGNLLGNACVHTPPDRAVTVRVGARREAGAAVCVVEVADNGPGIAPGAAPYVFDRFYRARPPGAGPAAGDGPDGEAEPGSGLGLAIASAIATAHGGRLTLDNRPGAGCVFRLVLPESGEPARPGPDVGASR